MFYQLKPSGNMPVVQVQVRPILGVVRLLPVMQITIGTEIIIQVLIISKPGMLASIVRTLGVFMTCTEMSGSGLRIGTGDMPLDR